MGHCTGKQSTTLSSSDVLRGEEMGPLSNWPAGLSRIRSVCTMLLQFLLVHAPIPIPDSGRAKYDFPKVVRATPLSIETLHGMLHVSSGDFATTAYGRLASRNPYSIADTSLSQASPSTSLRFCFAPTIYSQSHSHTQPNSSVFNTTMPTRESTARASTTRTLSHSSLSFSPVCEPPQWSMSWLHSLSTWASARRRRSLVLPSKPG